MTDEEAKALMKHTKMDLVNLIEDYQNVVAGLECEIERLEHKAKCFRGQMIKSGKEIVRLRREKKFWSDRSNTLFDTQRKQWRRLNEAEEIMWLVAGLEKRVSDADKPLMRMRGQARAWISRRKQS